MVIGVPSAEAPIRACSRTFFHSAAPADTAGSDLLASSIPAPRQLKSSKPTVLLADDAAAYRILVRLHIEADERFQVLMSEAENGKQAVKMVNCLKPDIVIIDFFMPVMDGLNAAAIIKRENPDTKVVMLTSGASPVVQDRLRRVGVEGYVVKGSDLDGLLDTLVALVAT